MIFSGFNVTDPDDGDSHTFTLVSSQFSSHVSVLANGGSIRVQNVLDREASGHPSQFTIGKRSLCPEHHEYPKSNTHSAIQVIIPLLQKY